MRAQFKVCTYLQYKKVPGQKICNRKVLSQLRKRKKKKKKKRKKPRKGTLSKPAQILYRKIGGLKYSIRHFLYVCTTVPLEVSRGSLAESGDNGESEFNSIQIQFDSIQFNSIQFCFPTTSDQRERMGKAIYLSIKIPIKLRSLYTA